MQQAQGQRAVQHSSTLMSSFYHEIREIRAMGFSHHEPSSVIFFTYCVLRIA